MFTIKKKKHAKCSQNRKIRCDTIHRHPLRVVRIQSYAIRSSKNKFNSKLACTHLCYIHLFTVERDTDTA